MFLPIIMKNAISGIVVLGFKKTMHTVDDIQMNILMGIANLASITIDKIVSISEQSMMTRELERFERLTAMGRIIAGVAHEINNPLSIMQLDIDELKTSCELENLIPARTVRDLTGSLQEEISRLSGIVKQLKDYSNPSSTSVETINVDDILKAYPVKIFLKNLQKKGITIEMRLNAAKTEIQIPKNRLIQVLMNLFSNADDAVEKTASPEILIETGKVFKETEMVYISVRDNGQGIPEENIQKIFEPFYTSKKSEGTGLGLSISYSIVKSYNGFITVNSIEGDGAEFKVFFPEIKDE
jgi:two-component system, NtrC family, sensor kinase